MILSYGWTWPAYCAEVKTCTRRHWQDDWVKRWKTERIHTAVNKQLCFGGHEIGGFILTREPYKERTSLMPDIDYRHEGMEYMDSIGFHPPQLKKRGCNNWREFFEAWRKSDELVYVVRTREIIVNAQGKADLAELLKEVKR